MVIPEDIEAYAAAHTTPEGSLLAAVATATRESTTAPGMMVGQVEGRFLETLVFLTGARRVLEIGTFTGYSALSMAPALAPGGTIVTCELDPVHAELARGHVTASPWADRIDIRVGPAIDTLATLDGPFDLVFVDADKEGYQEYFEAALPLLAPRGVMVFDNVLWSGKVLDPPADDPAAGALATFNDRMISDPRVTVVMLTVRDGVLLARHASPPEPVAG